MFWSISIVSCATDAKSVQQLAVGRKSVMLSNACPVCQATLTPETKQWHWVCSKCAYERSDFVPSIESKTAHELIDERSRESGLRELRIKNFNKLLAQIKVLKPNGGRLLDVGCAHGWFLDIARSDFDVFGLEPDHKFFAENTQSVLGIRSGYFPDALREDEKFDIIVFNDVIEHIPDINSTLSNCQKHLYDNGILVINLPSSSGFIYRLSKVFCKMGYTGFFERLWQMDLPSPHLHYFNQSNMSLLLTSCKFSILSTGRLDTLSLSGLSTRLSFTGDRTVFNRIALYTAIVMAFPLLRILPNDIFFVISQFHLYDN